jgi:hypothetical protein
LRQPVSGQGLSWSDLQRKAEGSWFSLADLFRRMNPVAHWYKSGPLRMIDLSCRCPAKDGQPAMARKDEGNAVDRQLAVLHRIQAHYN